MKAKKEPDYQQKANKKQEPSSSVNDSFENSCFSKSICSSTDCTGLIPALPSSEAELEAYEEMYQFCLANADHLPETEV